MKNIGIDFDNTLVNYDPIFCSIAIQQGLVNNLCTLGKRGVRDLVRKAPNGEVLWQQLQADVYGRYILSAELYPGVMAFLKAFKSYEVTFFIVSHKTPYASQDIEKKFPLIELANKWLVKNEIAAIDGPVKQKNIFFENSLEKKIQRISDLNIDIFIDDLLEVFLNADFPVRTRAILFGEEPKNKLPKHIHRFKSWFDISNFMFEDINKL